MKYLLLLGLVGYYAAIVFVPMSKLAWIVWAAIIPIGIILGVFAARS